MRNTSDTKKVLFRLNDSMKKEFTIALVNNDIGAQHVLEAFAERVIAFDKQEIKDTKQKSVLMSLFSRAKELQYAD